MIKQVSRKEAIIAAADDQTAFMFYKDEYGKAWSWNITANIDRTIYRDAEFAIMVPDEQDPEQEDPAMEQDNASEECDCGIGGSILMSKKSETSKRKIDTGLKVKRKSAELDKGKIFALSNAGWSVNKIADEMGVSWATVNNVLIKEKG